MGADLSDIGYERISVADLIFGKARYNQVIPFIDGFWLCCEGDKALILTEPDRKQWKYPQVSQGWTLYIETRHIQAKDLPDVLKRLYRLLKKPGVLYVSFKRGEGERQKDGRYFNDLSEEALCGLLRDAGFAVKEAFISRDVREDRRDECWVNVIAERMQ